MATVYDTVCAAIKTALDSVYVKKTDVVDNVSSTSTTNPLSANQGKQLNDKIGQAITYINQQESD